MIFVVVALLVFVCGCGDNTARMVQAPIQQNVGSLSVHLGLNSNFTLSVVTQFF